MVVTEKPKVFATSDGTEFTTKAEAERHEELCKARDEFDSARKRFQRALAGSFKTADGESFDLTSWHTFYYLTMYGSEGPQIHQISFGYGSEVLFDDDDIRVIEPEPVVRGAVARRIRISELYHHEAKAQQALIAALKEHGKRVDERINELKEKVAKLKGNRR